MSNWLNHVKSVMKVNPGKPLKDVLKIAKSSYKSGVAVVSGASKSESKGVKRTGKTLKRALSVKVGGKRRVARKTARKSRKSRRK